MVTKRKRNAVRNAPAPATDTELGIPAKSVQFLIVDDHSFVRGIVQQHLKSCGFDRFLYSQNGNDATQMLRRLARCRRIVPETAGSLTETAVETNADFNTMHTYCVITDFGMPGSNGLQLTKAIRCGQTGLPRNTPVVLLTGYSDDYVVAAAMALDVGAFLIKPVSRNALWEKVERVLKTNTPIKEISAYERVDIPNEDGHIIGAPSKSKAHNAEITQDDTDAVRWLPLIAVQAGALLAADLYGEHGTLLLRHGTVFSEGILHKLRDMHGFNGKIPVQNEGIIAAAGI